MVFTAGVGVYQAFIRAGGCAGRQGVITGCRGCGVDCCRKGKGEDGGNEHFACTMR